MRVLLCPLNDPGYLYPALAVGRELRRRIKRRFDEEGIETSNPRTLLLQDDPARQQLAASRSADEDPLP